MATNWIKRWEDNVIGWHKADYNQRLITWLPSLKLLAGDTILVPLCGKSLDMIYLINQGYKVIGVELSELAVQAFFKENKLLFNKTKQANFVMYYNESICLYVGNFFDLTANLLTTVNAVYDRASLIALPELKRVKYTHHLINILPKKIVILLLCLYYPQQQKSGPPFAVSSHEVKQLFLPEFTAQLLSSVNDLDKEPKFVEQSVDYLEKNSYLLRR